MERGRKIVDEIIAFPSRSGCAKVTSPLARINRSPSGDQLNGQDIKRSFRALPSPPFSLSGPCEISRKIVPTLSLLAGIIENGAATLTRPCFPSSSPTLRIRGRRNFSKNFFRRVGSNFGGICSISKKKNLHSSQSNCCQTRPFSSENSCKSTRDETKIPLLVPPCFHLVPESNANRF